MTAPGGLDLSKLDLKAFITNNSKEIRGPQIFAVAKKLRSQYKRLGAVGHCYGGWACFQLGAKGNDLVDAISVAHPSLLTKEEIDAVAVPVQVNSPEHDSQYTPEMKTHTVETLTKLGFPFDYQYFPGREHGFAVRGNPQDKEEQKDMIRAKNATASWFGNYLVLN